VIVSMYALVPTALIVQHPSEDIRIYKVLPKVNTPSNAPVS
jgi:hypothetical protein